jgi:Ca2+/Na+ antiporter
MIIYDLIIQIFMAATLIAGTIMLVFTIGYRNRLRRTERIGRYILSTLLLYSVTVRFLILLPGNFYWAKEASIGFDLLYIALCIFYNFNLLNRRVPNDREQTKNSNDDLF